ncbi:hypothetical protein BpHYR1_044964 [Brachionus plicatilis]|uniref:Uncharacterized protein n=1 Tax=Brachionus plicatilis TaxID=10195 RepID=A0A3M7SYE7_BRAPC|nr:hypothetical protein BpHYR1_044964 [Brachionus plicatilis]
MLKKVAAIQLSYDAERQTINRTQKANLPDYPPEPKVLSEKDIPDFLKITLPGIDDKTSCGNEDRFLCFSTDENIKLLENAHIFADGTFDICQRPFK